MAGAKQCTRLSVCALALAAGFCWGAGIFFLGLAAMQYDIGKPFIELFASIYIGYEATLKGSMIGSGWAFVDGLLGGFIFAIVYNGINRIAAKCCRSKSN